MKILIVEDEVVQREILAALLGEHDEIDLYFAGTLESAQRQLDDVDFVILDLYLPDADADETLAWLSSIKKPTIVCSVSTDRELIVDAAEAGAMAFLSKGSIGDQLICLIHFAMAREEIAFERYEQRVAKCQTITESMIQRAATGTASE